MRTTIVPVLFICIFDSLHIVAICPRPVSSSSVNIVSVVVKFKTSSKIFLQGINEETFNTQSFKTVLFLGISFETTSLLLLLEHESLFKPPLCPPLNREKAFLVPTCSLAREPLNITSTKALTTLESLGRNYI